MLLPISLSLGIIDTALLVFYVFNNYRKHGYFLSFFNVTIFVFVFCLIISPAFFVSKQSWTALDVSDLEAVRSFLCECWIVNLGGFAIFLLVLNAYTLSDKVIFSLPSKQGSWFLSLPKKINPRVVDFVFVCAVCVFVLICFVFNNGAFPLLNGKRDFFYQKSFSTIYLAVNCCINVLGLYYGIRAISARKGFAKFVACLSCSLLTGNRSGALLNILLPVALFFIYAKIKPLFKTTGKNCYIVISCLVIALAGLSLAILRSPEGAMGLGQLFEKIIDGNTFSDIRDGAFILRGFHLKMDGNPAFGNTYFAGLISFLPSSISDFREAWSWGRFTTQILSGWNSVHFGLRGGWFMEAYLNFGLFGVTTLGVVLGMLMGKLEWIFRRCFIERMKQDYSATMLGCSFMLQAFNSAVCTSAFYNIYVIGLLLIFLVVVSRFTPYCKKQSCFKKTGLLLVKH